MLAVYLGVVSRQYPIWRKLKEPILWRLALALAPRPGLKPNARIQVSGNDRFFGVGRRSVNMMSNVASGSTAAGGYQKPSNSLQLEAAHRARVLQRQAELKQSTRQIHGGEGRRCVAQCNVDDGLPLPETTLSVKTPLC